jgi:glycosyltransferase involved in cell wall biosynthesis
LKILHVNHLLDPVSGGGTAERTIQLTRFLVKQGAECAVLTLGIGDLASIQDKLEGARIFSLPCLNLRFYIYTPWTLSINKIVSEFDVVHLMGHWTLLNAIVALCCIRQGKPYVVCPAGALKPFGRSRWLKRMYDLLAGRFIIRSAKGWVAITEAEKLDFAAYGIGSDSVVVIPNGIDPEQYAVPPTALTAKPKLEAKAPFILFLGRLNPIKGPDLLLDAFIKVADRFPELELVFVGPDSGLLLTLQSTAARSAVGQRIHFAGYLGGQEKVEILRKALCLVIPSRNEAMSIVVLEAGICGTPVLFTDKCGLDDFFLAGAGVMVEVSVDSLCEGLVSILSNAAELHDSCNRLEKMIRGKFLWSSQAQRYYRFYQQILSS